MIKLLWWSTTQQLQIYNTVNKNTKQDQWRLKTGFISLRISQSVVHGQLVMMSFISQIWSSSQKTFSCFRSSSLFSSSSSSYLSSTDSSSHPHLSSSAFFRVGWKQVNSPAAFLWTFVPRINQLFAPLRCVFNPLASGCGGDLPVSALQLQESDSRINVCLMSHRWYVYFETSYIIWKIPNTQIQV